MQYLEPAARSSARVPLARWICGSAAVLLTLAAPAVSTWGALTTGLNGTSPAVGFPPGYGVTLAATVAATTLAAVLAALIARRDALVAIPVSLGIWAITGLGVVAAGIQLGHTGLTHWGIVLVAASLIGAVVGVLVAGRGQPGRPTRGLAATDSVQAGSGRSNNGTGSRLWIEKMVTGRSSNCPAAARLASPYSVTRTGCPASPSMAHPAHG